MDTALNAYLVNEIRSQMSMRETEELLEIWYVQDIDEWSPEAFEAIRQILLDRLGRLPAQEDRLGAISHLDQAQVYMGDDEYQQALQECDLAIELAPHLPIAYNMRGVVLDEMDRLEEAIAAYRQAVRLSPNLKEAQRNLRYSLDELALRTSSQTERILAALAHGCILSPGIGIIGSTVIWATQHDKSVYVRFQALQAVVFQVAMIAFQFAFGCCWIIGFFGMGLLGASGWGATSYSVFLMMFVFFGLIQVLPIIYGLFGAINCLRGRDFHYFWIGFLVERYLS